MKKTRLMAGLLLVMLFTAVNCVMALAGTSKINGHLDSVEGKAVSGWLWDSGKPEESQTVTVTVTDEHSGQVAAAVSVLASEYRGDLTEDGMGTGNYGFHVEIDWDSLPPSSYIISLSSSPESCVMHPETRRLPPTGAWSLWEISSSPPTAPAGSAPRAGDGAPAPGPLPLPVTQ